MAHTMGPASFFAVAMLAAGLLLAAVPRAQADRLDTILARGTLICGLVESGPGLAEQSGESDVWRGFDIDACAAMAAAMVGDAKAFEIAALDPNAATSALAEGQVDLLVRAVPRGLRQRLQAELLFTAQGLMVRHGSGPRNLAGLGGQAVCVQNGETRQRLTAYLSRSEPPAQVFGFPSLKQAALSFIGGACAAVSGPRIDLALIRRELEQTPRSFELIGELMDLAPSGPIVAPGEERLGQAVRWIVFSLLEAERLGVTRRSLADDEDVAQLEDPAVARLLGVGGHLDALGLPEGWSRRAIAAVGNYKEVYDRHLGALSPLRLERGPNALQEDGGLLLLPSMQ